MSWTNSKSNRERFLKLLDASRGQRILDVGAGKGAVANMVMMSTGAEVYALDPDEKRIAFIGQRYQGVKCQVATAESIPFSDSFFDRVYTSMALHHFAEVERALTEFERVLRSGGLLVIIDIDPRSVRGRLLQFVENKITRHQRRFLDQNQILEELARGGTFSTTLSVKGSFYYIIQCMKSNPYS